MLGKEWLSTTAPLGSFDHAKQTWEGLGAGVFIYDEPFTWYVTANQLINNKKNGNFNVLVHHKKTKHCLVDIKSLHQQHKIEWLVNETEDIAATLFPSNPDFSLKSIPYSSFINSNEMSPSMNCYSVGFPYSLASSDMDCIQPYVLNGIISGIDKEHLRMHVSLPTYPGNIGGPLFVLKDRSISSVCFGGIIVDHVLVDNGDFPPLNLTTVMVSETIQELLSSQKAIWLKERVRK